MDFYQYSKIAAILFTGLIAGFFYGFQCSITNGLGQLSDKEYLLGFQAINKAIQNPTFFISFMGCLFILPLVCWLAFKNGDSSAFNFLMVATLMYTIGVFGLTIFGNVPLNEMLANFNINTASVKELALQRKAFEPLWNRYHLIRTVLSIMSFLLTILATIKIK